MPVAKKVTVDARTWAFALKELDIVHELMNAAEIPREIDGEKLSVAQRVFMYTKMTEGTRAALFKAAGNAPH